MKKGQIWVSAVLYIALTIVALTLVISAGVPLIQKIKDRNVVIQTKELMNIIDVTINNVYDEGVGSQRVLDTVIIKGGNLVIDETNDKIYWELETETIVVEPCEEGNPNFDVECVIKEGSLSISELETRIVDEYKIKIEMIYSPDIDLIIKDGSFGENNNPLNGKFKFVVSKTGDNKIEFNIT